MDVLKIRIFLAASSDLSNDRNEFEIFISRENKSLIKRNVFLELVIWEDFIDSMSKTRLQDEYNKAILRSDIFIMLVHGKVGKYSIEEFKMAFYEFKKIGKPAIFTYFKNAPVRVDQLDIESNSNVREFKATINSLGHFASMYDNIDSLKQQFSSQLNRLIDSNWNQFLPSNEVNENERKTKVFISYSHKDTIYLERLLVHLRPLTKMGIVDIWVDTKLSVGDKWKSQIEKALRAAKVAVLLISADFLASDFIVDNELPPILDAAESNGTQLIPVILKPCRFSRDKKLSLYQAINSPDKPLMGLSEYEQELIYDKIAEWVEVNF